MDKKITWEIGVQKPAGNVLCDSSLHYNRPLIVLMDETPLKENVNFTFSPDYDGVDYSNNLGYLDFTLSGGMYATQTITVIFP